MKRRMAAWICAAALCFLILPALGESMHREVANPDFTMETELGWEGLITYGKAFPVTVTVHNNGADFEGFLGMNTYESKREYNRYEMRVSLPAGASGRYVLPVKVQTRQKQFTAELTDEAGNVLCAVNAEPVMVVNPSAMQIGVLSTRPLQCSNLNISRDNDALSRYEVWQTVPLTEETFPDRMDLMSAFGMLAVDDVDLNTLPAACRDTLLAWLRNGHIILIGGGARAAANLSFFAEETGLTVDTITVAEGVIPALQRGLGLREEASGPAVSLTRLSGGTPILTDSEGNGLVWRSRLGAGSIYVSAFETGDAALNANPLMHTFWQRVLVKWDTSLYQTVLYPSNYEYVSTIDAAEYVPLQGSARLLPAVLIVLSGLLAGCVAWVILKRRDRQTWLWLVLPIIAAAGSALICLLGFTSDLAGPTALSSTLVLQSEDGAASAQTAVTAAHPSKGFHWISTAGELRENRWNGYLDYYYDEDDEIKEPTTLLNIRRFGTESALGYPCVSPWETTQFLLEGSEAPKGRLQTAVWMEADGLHGEIENLTEYTLESGLVLTSYGYASVPDLAPGEKADFALIRAVQAQQNPVWEDGKMYEGSQGYTDVGTMVMNATSGAQRGSLAAADDRERNRTGSIFQTLGYRLNEMSDAAAGGYGNVAYTFYTTMIRDYESPEVRLDGQTPKQTGSLAAWGALLQWQAIGRTGIVYHPFGMDGAIPCLTNEYGLPDGDDPESENHKYWYTLSDSPVFRFDLSDSADVEWKRLTVGVQSYGTEPRVYLLDGNRLSWTEVGLNKPIEDPGAFFGKDGQLYVRLESDGSDLYAESMAPAIILEGGVKNAANP